MSIAYVGCRTSKERKAHGKGLSVYHVNDTNGEWTLTQLLEGVADPTFLCLDREQRFLYAVHGDGTTASSFAIHGAEGFLKLLNTVDIAGKNPVSLVVDKENRYLYVSSLQGGAVAACRRLEDGSLSCVEHLTRLEGTSESGLSHAHQCCFDPLWEYLFVPTQGRGKGFSGVFVFRPLPDGSLARTQRFLTRKIDESRHLVIHPNNRYVYILNENSSTVTFCVFNREKGQLEARQIVSTLPETYTGENQAAEILVSPDGKWLYASNRTHDSIAHFSIDANTGFVRLLSCTPSLGGMPRFMTFTPDSKALVVANETTDTLRVFRIDLNSGTPVFADRTVFTESPVCIVWKTNCQEKT
jgi:6-phosphogluconolactonase (cycloisomerase 2 family)